MEKPANCPPSEPASNQQSSPDAAPAQAAPAPVTALDMEMQPAASMQATPEQRLAKLQADLRARESEVSKLEPMKAEIAELAARIKSLEKAIESESAASAAYTDFYREMERYGSEANSIIKTVRGQLALSKEQLACIQNAVATVDQRVKKAQGERDAQDAIVTASRSNQEQFEAKLARSRKRLEYFTTGLKAQATRRRDELKALNQLAVASKDPSETAFYLSDMEALLTVDASAGQGETCYRPELNLATFLDCWKPACYSRAYQRLIVEVHEAEKALKDGAAALAADSKQAADLAKAAKDAETRRREWILKEIKAQGCSGMNPIAAVDGV